MRDIAASSPDFARWHDRDLQAESTAGIDRTHLPGLLKAYFARAELSADWEAIGARPRTTA